MTRTRVLRPLVHPGLLALTTGAVLVLVVLSRVAVAPVPGTRLPVVVAAVVVGAALALTTGAVGPGWRLWRATLTGAAVLAIVYPGAWALAVLASRAAAGGVAERVAVSTATVLHLPLLACFTVLPVLAVSYLGRGARTGVVRVVWGLGLAAAVSLVLFLADAEPFLLPALLPWRPGAVVGPVLHLGFLVLTVVGGPLVALLAAWRAPGHAARRLALVAASSLGGSVLVMACGALAPTEAGAVIVLGALYAALAAVALGSSYALVAPPTRVAVTAEPAPTVPQEAPPAPVVAPPVEGRRHPALTPRESEVVALLAEGLSNAGIAARLVLSQRTVDAHLRSAFAKLDLPDGPDHNRRVHAAVTWRGEVGPGPREGPR